MKAPILARLILGGFISIFALAATYLLLDTFGIWPRLPAGLTHGVAILTGSILLLALLGHLVLATGALPAEDTDADRGR
jgi:hypothetical protein